MNPFDKLFGKKKSLNGEAPSEEEPKGSKLVKSYNVTYDQLKKQENPQASVPEAKVGPESEGGGVPGKKKTGRFSRLASQFKKIDLQDPLNKIKQQPKNIMQLINWFQSHKMAGITALLVLGLILAWAVSAIFFGDKTKAGGEAAGVEVVDAGTQVKVLKVTKTDFSDSILAMGTIKGFAQVNLGFQVPGIVSAFNFREGDEIKAGQIIVQIDPQEQLLKYEEAKVGYNNAQALYDLGAIIPLKLQEAKIKLDLAQNELTKTAIVAPTDGILGSRDVEVGSTINQNMKVATFLDINDVFAEVGIMEREINKVVVGQDVKINVDAYPDLDFGGTVTNIAPMVKGKSKTLNVKVQIANPYRLLLPGMFVRVRVKIFETKNAIIIPRPALKKVKGAYHVFTVNPNNKAEFKTVKLGYVTTDNVQITEGLNEGDLVAVEGIEELKDGAKVQVMEYQSTSF